MTARKACRAALWPIVLALLGSCGSYRVRWQGVELPPAAVSRPQTSADKISRAAELNNLGVYFERQGDLENALNHYRLAQQYDPSLTVAHVNAGNVNLRLGNWPSAISYYREALRLDAENPRALNNLAWVYLLRGEKVGEAVELARRALEADPVRRYLYLDTLGWALWKSGRADQSLEALEEALEITPEEETALLGETHYHLGVILLERGETETAARHLQESLKRHPSRDREREIRGLLGY